MWCKNVGACFFRFVTIHSFDRRTDGQTDRRTDISLVSKTALRRCSAVKMRFVFGRFAADLEKASAIRSNGARLDPDTSLRWIRRHRHRARNLCAMGRLQRPCLGDSSVCIRRSHHVHWTTDADVVLLHQNCLRTQTRG